MARWLTCCRALRILKRALYTQKRAPHTRKRVLHTRKRDLHTQKRDLILLVLTRLFPKNGRSLAYSKESFTQRKEVYIHREKNPEKRSTRREKNPTYTEKRTFLRVCRSTYTEKRTFLCVCRVLFSVYILYTQRKEPYIHKTEP